MSQDVSGETAPDKFPLSQAGLSSLIIGVAALSIDNTTATKIIGLLAPVASYFTIRFIRKRRRKLKLKELCDTIDDMIKLLEDEHDHSSTGRHRKVEIQKELAELKKTKNEHLLANVDIKLNK